MRPEFHFTAQTGWINDPHGITPRNGGYELFYQYVPDSLVWAPNCHWGHAFGSDLFTWEELPVALAPGDGDDGVWTGSLVIDESGLARIFYTGVTEPDIGVGRVRIAKPKDASWLEWEKGRVVVTAPPDLDVVAYRDPVVVKEGDVWRMFMGAGLRNGDAAALNYTSSDLESWSYEGITARRSTLERQPAWMGAMWECPQLFELQGRHVLVSSVWDDDVLYYAGYGIGRYSDGIFEAETWGQLTFGPSYYAPSLFRDEAGRVCLTLWMRGVQDAEAGWSSAHSVPHVLRIDGDRLIAEPHPDLERYQSAIHSSPSPVAVEGNAVDALWTPGGEGPRLLLSTEASEMLRLEVHDDALVVTRGSDEWKVPYIGGDVRVIVDGPLAEVSCTGGILGTAVEITGRRVVVTASAGSVALVRTLRRTSE